MTPEVQVFTVRPAYLLMYVIETTRGSVPASTRSSLDNRSQYLVYTSVRNMRDVYFERIINHNPMVYAALRGEKGGSYQRAGQLMIFLDAKKEW